MTNFLVTFKQEEVSVTVNDYENRRTTSCSATSEDKMSIPLVNNMNASTKKASLPSSMTIVADEGDRSSSSLASNKRTRILHTSEQLARRRPFVRVQDFLDLEEPHPYGVLPGGNRFLLLAKDATTATVTTTVQDLLNDECWYAILEFLSGPDLGRVQCTCRYLYVAASQPELWRDLVLASHAIISYFCQRGGGWKDTLVSSIVKEATTNTTDSIIADHNTARRSSVPIRMPNIYSDFFHRLHSCRTFRIPEQWLIAGRGRVDDETTNSLPCIPVKSMTTERFRVDFEQANRPVLIQGAASTWKALTDWKNAAYWSRHTSGKSFRATSGLASRPADFTWKAYSEYCKSSSRSSSSQSSYFLHEEAPMYLFDRTALTPGSPLWNDYMPDLQRTCPYWDPSANACEQDLFGLLGEGKRPDHTWLICGPQRSGSIFHVDPNATHAWNACIAGCKRWIFYPPHVVPPGVHPSADGDQVALPLSVGEWLLSFWPEHVARFVQSPLEHRPLECTAYPGDVVFVPHGWWHMVINLSEEMNVAITHNYVSVSNLSSVLQFLVDKNDQVSGCRDRAESIKPDQLHHVFCDALQKAHPSLLQEALSKMDGASCQAWSSSPNPDKTVAKRSKKAKTKHSKNRRDNSSTTGSIMSQATSGITPNSGGFSFSFL